MTEQINPEDYEYVIAADPGGTTGIAMLRYTQDTLPELVWLSQLKDGRKGYYDFFNGTSPADNVVVVSESFTLREGVHGADLTPVYIEGMQYAFWGDEVVYQEPSMKKLIPDSWLKEQNLWTPGHRHQMDALIHAFVYLRNQMHEPTLEALAGQAEQTVAEPGEAKEKTLDFQKELTQEDVEKIYEAVNKLYGGDRPEDRERETPAPGEGEGESGEPGEGEGEGGESSGEPDGEGEGDPSGSGNYSGEWHEPEKVEVTGTRGRLQLNGAFSGFDTD